MADSHSTRTKAFISYSHADEEHRARLRTHLGLYIREQNIDVWDDTHIEPGDLWKDEIKQAIASAKVAILLVSADFLASDFIANDELPPLLDAAKKDGLIIFSVILSSCGFKNTKLANYQAFNKPSEPVIDLNKARQEKIWAELAEKVADVLRKAANPQPFVANTASSDGRIPGETTNRQPHYTKEVECFHCGGYGKRRVGQTGFQMGYDVTCSLCNGSGKVLVPLGYHDDSKPLLFYTKRYVICQACGWKNKYDTGKYGNDPLPTYCAGCGAMFE